MGDEAKTTAKGAEPAMPAGRGVLPGLLLDYAARSERSARPANEDRYLVVRLDRATTPLATNIEPEQLTYVAAQSAWGLAVADGMGGHAAGEVASTLALGLALQLAQHGARWYVDIGEAEARELIDRAGRIIRQVDRKIAERGQHSPEWSGMGTTLTVAVLYGDRAFLYHVGDSRAYVLRQDHLRRLTRDHTIAQELADARLIASDEVGRHHTRHLLTQAMGRGDVAVEVQQFRLEDGDRLLLATDGLTDVVAEDALKRLLAHGSAQTACAALVERALKAGVRDNVTAVVADVRLDRGGQPADA